MSDKAKQNLSLTCMFGAFVFLQFTLLGLANRAGEGYLTTAQRDLVYYVLQVLVILGYLLYSLISRLCFSGRARRITVSCTLALFLLCLIVMLAAGSDSLLNVIVSMAAVLCLGGIGGGVHHRMSLETVMGAEVAKCMGFGSAAAVVLQYLLQIRSGAWPLLAVFMLASLLFLFFLLYRKPAAFMPGDRRTEKMQPGRILSPVFITAVFLLSACFYNEYIHHLMIRSDYTSYNVYSWPRLMLVPGYLLFAAVGDRKNGKYVPVMTLCIMLIAQLNVILTGSSGAYWLNMCLFYFTISAFTSYYLLSFWRLAPKTGNPALWAPFGRILDSAMVLFTGAIHLSALPVPVVLGGDVIGISLVILTMALSGDLNLSGAGAGGLQAIPEEKRNSHEAPDHSLPIRSQEETMARMRERYDLTPREAEVLRELVLTEDKQAVISERLNIQVKTLQDYVTRLYRKTGAATRSGLTVLYHENRHRP